MPDRVKWPRMSKITNDGLTRSGRGCFIAVPIIVGTVGVKELIPCSHGIYTVYIRQKRSVIRQPHRWKDMISRVIILGTGSISCGLFHRDRIAYETTRPSTGPIHASATEINDLRAFGRSVGIAGPRFGFSSTTRREIDRSAPPGHVGWLTRCADHRP